MIKIYLLLCLAICACGQQQTDPATTTESTVVPATTPVDPSRAAPSADQTRKETAPPQPTVKALNTTDQAKKEGAQARGDDSSARSSSQKPIDQPIQPAPISPQPQQDQPQSQDSSTQQNNTTSKSVRSSATTNRFEISLSSIFLSLFTVLFLVHF